jgi:hypothetical protein
LLVWTQSFPWHASSVQGFPSSQSRPLLQSTQPPIVTWLQPLFGSHESVVHGFPSSQLAGAPPTHVPPWQASRSVQALPSSHAVPSGWAGFEQTPVVGSHTPAAWHWSVGVQVTSVPLHCPP